MTSRVSPQTLLLGGLTVIAAGTIGYLGTRAFVREPPTPFACPPGEHVGTVGYVWPRPELFLDESGFGEALESFGYAVPNWDAPGWTPCSESVVRTVETLQRDFNRAHPELPSPPPQVRTDGLIDDATVEAMAFIHSLHQSGESWSLIVSKSKGQPV